MTKIWKQIDTAAKQGDAQAQVDLGVMYKYGLGGEEQDYKTAVGWFKKAAEQGNAQAQEELGVMYFRGKGVEKDRKTAKELYEKAAKQGNVKALEDLGVMYLYGVGVQQDSKMGMRLLIIANFIKDEKRDLVKKAEEGNAQAQYKLDDMYNLGEKMMNQDFEAVAEWFTKAAKHGNVQAQCALGLLYKNWNGVDQDFEAAAGWFAKAAEQGNGLYDTNHEKAEHFYGNVQSPEVVEVVDGLNPKAAEQGDAQAQYNLEFLYEEAAERLNPKAAGQGNGLYDTNQGNDKNHEKAEHFYGKARLSEIEEGADGVLVLSLALSFIILEYGAFLVGSVLFLGAALVVSNLFENSPQTTDESSISSKITDETYMFSQSEEESFMAGASKNNQDDAESLRL